MAKRQDSGSNSAHKNQTPDPDNEDAVPEMTDETRGAAEIDDEDEFEDTEDLDEEEDEANEGSD